MREVAKKKEYWLHAYVASGDIGASDMNLLTKIYQAGLWQDYWYKRLP